MSIKILYIVQKKGRYVENTQTPSEYTGGRYETNKNRLSGDVRYQRRGRDAANGTIREINRLHLTAAQATRVLKLLEAAITRSIDNSKIEVGELVYCEYDRRPRQRP